MKTIQFYPQLDFMDCGPACLKMIANSYGKYFSLGYLRKHCNITIEGVSLLGISNAAEKIGLRAQGIKISIKNLIREVKLPIIVHWNQEHFVVVYKISSKYIYVADPAHGKLKYSFDQFEKSWAIPDKKNNGSKMGICLILEPMECFLNTKEVKDSNSYGISFLIRYLKPYKTFVNLLLVGLFITSIIQLTLPFITQLVVDIGINSKSIRFIFLLLVSQLILLVSRLSLEFIRSWIMLHVSTRINISIISDFLIKLMKLPIRFFNTKMTGDIIQRIEDHSRVETFITGQSVATVFSIINIILFSGLLAFYNVYVFLIFILSSILYICWIHIFLKKRKDLDYKRFTQMSSEQNTLMQLIIGMQDIKLNNCEKQMRWKWERIQSKLFKINIKGLSISQYQNLGGLFFLESKNLIITAIAAKEVIEGNMSIGMMISIQFILGQLSVPLNQIINFIHSGQDAKISLKRLGEIHGENNEFEDEDIGVNSFNLSQSGFQIKNLTFQYEGKASPKILENINVAIPRNKITAIVGTSGSGKTTLIKLLLGFYNISCGVILLDDKKLSDYDMSWWRTKCGVVLQDGFIFSETIANNIAIGEDEVNKERLIFSCKTANILEIIERLPLGFNTKIGQDGIGLSQGQKQRILIARAVYKNPDFIFLDEATNALDANNERTILDNLNAFFQGRTVVVVAHRLSTVKNADNIIVLDKGCIVETGNHTELVQNEGAYYSLVKNQLELGN